MREQLKVLLWFARRPALYPELGRWVRRAITVPRSLRKTQQRESRAWCEARAVDALTAVEQITGARPPASGGLEARFAPELADARARVSRASVKMGMGGEMDLVFHLADWTKATRAIETGVGPGWSSLAFLLSMRDRAEQAPRLVSTHMPYPGLPAAYESFVGSAVPDDLKRYWHIVRLPDREGLPRALELLPTIDICHYDSDKSSDGREFAYARLWSALRPGGVFISDDIDDTMTFAELSERTRVAPIVVRAAATGQDKFVGVLIKPEVKPEARPGPG